MNKIYLIYGNEEYFMKEHLDKIKHDYKDYDLVVFDMLTDNISTALEDALMGSLFSTNKLIICDNCYFLTGNKCEIDHDIDDLIKYINIDSDNILVLIVNSESLDKRKKIVKELEGKSNVNVFNKLKDYELISFIKDYCKNNGYKIDTDAINLFNEKLTNNLYIITSELDKLFLFKNCDKQITKMDVDNVTSKVINDNIFDLIDAIVKKNIDKSLELYDDLLLLNEEEIKLIVILANQFRLIYQVKEMYKSGYSEFDIAKMLDIHPYRIKLAKNIEIKENTALKYLRELATLDELIKTGEIDKRIGFEKFILGILD